MPSAMDEYVFTCSYECRNQYVAFGVVAQRRRHAPNEDEGNGADKRVEVRLQFGKVRI